MPEMSPLWGARYHPNALYEIPGDKVFFCYVKKRKVRLPLGIGLVLK